MCNPTISSSSQCNCSVDQVLINGNNELQEEHSITIPFIPKLLLPEATPTVQVLKPSKTVDDRRSMSLAFVEAKSILSIALPMVVTGLILYSRSMISMLFLGRLGRLPLAGGSLAIGFANISGYSVLSGLAMGMEPVCSQAFGARKHSLLGLALQQMILLLLSVTLPIAVLWVTMERILLLCGQDPDIAAVAQNYILFSLPDLLLQSLLHPLRIYLRSQAITLPLTYCSAAAISLHLPINYLLVSVYKLGVPGVSLAGVWTNLNLVVLLIAYVYFSGTYRRTGGFTFNAEWFKGWKSLVGLAIPSCVSVCLEWWWYEIMVLLCGLLADPKSTVASMGILIQTTSLLYIFPSSLGFGVSTRVGNELGANRPDRARRAGEVGVACSFVLGVSSLFFAFSVRNIWARIFTGDASIAALTATVLPILGLSELGNCPQTTGFGVLRGSARPRAGANINLGSFYVVGTPVAIWLAFFNGLDFRGLWIGLLAAQATCVALMLTVIIRTNWDTQAQRAQILTAGSGTTEDDEFDIKKQKDSLKPASVGGGEDNADLDKLVTTVIVLKGED